MKRERNAVGIEDCQAVNKKLGAASHVKWT
jgi:hypothetical protein